MAREWTVWFLGCLFFLTGTTFLFSSLDDVTQVFPQGTGFLLEDFWYWLVSYLPWLLPICCLGASLFCLSFIKKRGEWTAILANGISPWQCFIIILLIGMGVGWTSDWLMKSSGIRLMDQSDTRIRSLKMPIGLERLWYFQSFNPSKLSGNDLQLFCYGKKGEDVLRIRAQRADWDTDKGWTFYHGRFLGFYSSQGLPLINQDQSGLIWEKADPEIKTLDPNLHTTKSPGISRKFDKLKGLYFEDNPIPFLWLQKRPKDMTLPEINRLLDLYPNPQSKKIIPYKLRKAQLWWNGPACVVALLFGLSLGSLRSAASPAKLAGVSLLGALVFYLVQSMSNSLGEQQIIGPFISASMPYLLVLLSSMFFFKMKK